MIHFAKLYLLIKASCKCSSLLCVDENTRPEQAHCGPGFMVFPSDALIPLRSTYIFLCFSHNLSVFFKKKKRLNSCSCFLKRLGNFKSSVTVWNTKHLLNCQQDATWHWAPVFPSLDGQAFSVQMRRERPTGSHANMLTHKIS